MIVDTNVIAEIFRATRKERSLIGLESLTGDTAITSVTFAELPADVRRLVSGRQRRER